MSVRGLVWWVVLVALAVPAGALTAIRATDPSDGRAVRLVSFTPFGLLLYALVALWLVGAWALRRRSARRRGWLLPATALTLAGLVTHLWWFHPLLVGAVPQPTGERLTVMTSNLLMGEADGLQVVEAASDSGVDVLVLEEVTEGVLARMEAAGLEDLFPYRIGDAVPAGRTDGTMVLSRLPLGEPDRVDTDMESWAVTVGEGEDAVELLAVHPAAPVDPVAWRSDHAAVLAAAEEHDADLVVGDFNATLDHEPMRALEDAGWRDAAELANQGWQPTWPANGLFEHLPLPALVQIDHVLLGPRMTATATSTLHVDGTDHRAVIAEVGRR